MSKDNFKAFGYEEVKKHQEKYKEETEKRYGNSDAYKESQEKSSKYSKLRSCSFINICSFLLKTGSAV